MPHLLLQTDLDLLQRAQDFIDKYGLQGAIILVGLWAILLLVNAASKDHDRAGKNSDVNLSELVKMREDYQESIEQRLELERRFTECREDLATARERYINLEAKQQQAVDEFLEETDGFAQALAAKEQLNLNQERLILDLQQQLTNAQREKDEANRQLEARDSTIKQLEAQLVESDSRKRKK